MKKNITYTICLVLCLGIWHAQTFEKDMAQVYNNFVNTKGIAYRINYVLKENHKTGSRTIMEAKGKYIKSNDSYISEYDGKMSLVTNKQIVMIDRSEKKIRVKKLKDVGRSAPDFMKELAEYNKNVLKTTRMEDSKKGVVIYRVELKKTEIFPISHYEISIHTKTGFIEQLSLFYKKPIEKNEEYQVTGTEIPRLDILFYDVNAPKLFSEKELEEDYYYTIHNKQLSPSVNFTGYDVKEIF